MMNNDSSANKVDTACRLARWRINNFTRNLSRKSEPFKIGMWNWHLSVESKLHSFLTLYPEFPTVASFNIRVFRSFGDIKALAHSEIKDKLLRTSKGYVWIIGASLPNKFIIEIEFLDLKMACPKDGALYSILPRSLQQRSNATSNKCLGRMLTEGINTYITIYGNIFNESIRAHRVVLAGSSPIFRSMFSHNFKENNLLIINISDMSFEACRALINYVYGTIKDDEFLTHRLALLHAADKYDMSESHVLRVLSKILILPMCWRSSNVHLNINCQS